MGLFDAFRQVHAESPGRVMLIQLNNAKSEMASMSDTARGQILTIFVHKREDLLNRKINMTQEGQLKVASDLQIAGNRLLRTDPLAGYPLLLAGMWLESGLRPGDSAFAVSNFLDEVATEMGGSFRT